MEKLKSLNRYQKAILLLMTCIVLIFTVLYPVTINRVGFAYKNTILIPSQKDGITTYSGKIKGKPAIFTVSEDKIVHFQYDDKLYGPYTAKESPDSVPRHNNFGGALTGVELYCGKELIFRGGILKTNGDYLLINKV